MTLFITKEQLVEFKKLFPKLEGCFCISNGLWLVKPRPDAPDYIRHSGIHPRTLREEGLLLEGEMYRETPQEVATQWLAKMASAKMAEADTRYQYIEAIFENKVWDCQFIPYLANAGRKNMNTLSETYIASEDPNGLLAEAAQAIRDEFSPQLLQTGVNPEYLWVYFDLAGKNPDKVLGHSLTDAQRSLLADYASRMDEQFTAHHIALKER